MCSGPIIALLRVKVATVLLAVVPGNEVQTQVMLRLDCVSTSDLLARSPPPEHQTEVYLNVYLLVHLLDARLSSVVNNLVKIHGPLVGQS
jgi:hypothetical protein